MKPVVVKMLCASACVVAVAVTVRTQQIPAVPAKNDPRVGLKAGYMDAGEEHPAGGPTPPERDPKLPPPDPNAAPDPRVANMLGFANSDLAFTGTHAFMGNFHGFNTYDVENGQRPKLLASVVCPGGQGDI
jgi:hypothetical protein